MGKRKFTNEQEREIERQYREEKISAYTLAKRWNCNVRTIYRILDKWGKTRSVKESKMTNSFKQLQKQNNPAWRCGENNPFYGKIYSEESREKTSIRTKEGMNNPEVKKKCGWSLGLTKETDERVAKMANLKKSKKILRKKSYSPEAIQKSLRNGYGKKCYYDNEFFPSLSERNCYIKLKKLGFNVEHNFKGRFDFLVNDKIVVEYHSFDFDLTDEQYYEYRRKLLNDYGYEDLKLVVIKDIKDIENKLI